MIPWMAMHAAGILTRFRVGNDGRTAHHKTTGRKFQKEIADFGNASGTFDPSQPESIK